MADERFIAGIFNYCDRWCERCAFTTRCRVFAKEVADRSADAESLGDDDLLLDIEKSLAEAVQLLRAEAEKRGIDIDTVQESEPSDVAWQDLESDDLINQARHYTRSAGTLLGEIDADAIVERLSNENDDEAPVVADQIEVIRWYQHQIPVKITRATAGLVDATVQGEDYMLIDADGSAKVALIGIDRSLLAWQSLAAHSAELSPRVSALIANLVQLRNAIEQRFPDARSFLRPGFDMPAPDLLS